MENQFLTLERVKELQNIMGFLNDYKTPVKTIHHIGPDINTSIVLRTKWLKELGEVNKRREELINLIMQ